MTVNSRRSKLWIAATIAALTLCYARVLASLVDAWTTNYLYSYAVAVPLISGYMVWARWAELRVLRRSPDYRLGIPVTLAGIGMLLGGDIGTIEAIEQLSLIVTMIGAVLLLFGRRALGLTWFPLVYLLLAIPVWDRLIDRLQDPSQIVSARISVGLLRLYGIPAVREDTMIALPNVTLQVLRECSGVNQLISVTAMALPAAFLWLKSSWRRLLLIAIAISVAYLSNGFRIALVGALGYHELSDGTLGPLHIFEGLAVSLVGYGVIFGCLSLLSRGKSDHGSAQADAQERATDTGPHGSPRPGSWAEVGILMVLVSVATLRLAYHPSATLLADELRTLPMRIGHWVVDVTGKSASELRLAGVDDEVFRVYRNPSGDRIRLYVGYHRYQERGKELTAHAGSVMPATRLQVELTSTAEVVELNQIVRQTAKGQTGTLFWYDLNGRIVASNYRAKAYLLFDALTRGRTNGALIIVDWEVPAGGSFEDSRRRAIGFVEALVPVLAGYIPS
jgi:EpsI family protein